MSAKDTHSARIWVAITPSNSVNIVMPEGRAVRALWSGSGGDAALVDDYGNVEVFTLTASREYALGPRRVNATGTTATGLKALG